MKGKCPEIAVVRKLTAKGLDFIVLREGVRLKPYNDTAGHCTIGIGHLLHPGPCTGQEKSLTLKEVRELFMDDVQKFVDGVLKVVKVSLLDYELDALTSFAFNVGLGAFGRSTLLKKLNAGDRAAVPSEMAKWVKEKRNGEMVVAPGAVRRRALEGRIFAEGIYPA